jgi:ubiquinone/menaquinone biosynthesis C-methylase UbiE
MSINIFDRMGTFWEEIAEKSQTEEQVEFLKKQILPEAYILDLACGTGRHTVALKKAGFDVVGMDISTNLLNLAKKCTGKIDLIKGDLRSLPFKENAFKSLISMDTSIGYLPSENEDKTGLTEARRVLKKDGIIIIDVFNQSHLMKKYYFEKNSCSEYPSFFLEQNRKISTNGKWLRDLWIIRKKSDCKKIKLRHKVRLYSFECWKEMLEEANFTTKQFFGGYLEQSYSTDSPRLIIVAEKK